MVLIAAAFACGDSDDTPLGSEFIGDILGSTPGTVFEDTFTMIKNVPPPTMEFQRGDCNNDANFNISDPSFLLSALLGGGAPPICDDACDGNDDGTLNIADIDRDGLPDVVRIRDDPEP